MNFLTKIGIGIFALIVVFSMTSHCRRDTTDTAQEPRATELILKEYSKGLNLAATTELAKKAKDAADFERLLNSQTEAINNIDLNDDGKVDYIKVTEYGSGEKRGFSLTDEISPGNIQEIATIDIERGADKATVQTTGNPSLYGPGSHHHSSFGLTDALLVGWLFSNRPSYSSPYGYGNYPLTYGSGWNRQGNDGYDGAMKSRNAGSTVTSSSKSVISNPAASPNAEKIAAKAKVISSPTQSQRSFAKSVARPTTSQSASRPSSSGGFGRSSSSGSSRSGSSSRGGK
jgi:hypothetical protein